MQYWNIEVSERMYEVITDLFDFSGMPVPDSITSNDMKQVVNKMKVIVNSKPSSVNLEKYAVINHKLKQLRCAKKALIISDIGVVRYQIKVLFNNNGIEAKTSESYYNGLAEYIKGLYDVVIVDVGNKVNEAEKIIDEIRRLSAKHSAKTSIIVLSSPTARANNNKFIKFGINKVIEKFGNWYQEIEQEIKKMALVPV